MQLTLDGIRKRVGAEIWLHDATLSLEPGAVTVLLGGTQAGKTSLMRLMAGLDTPTVGTIWFDGQYVTGVPVQKRNVAMVYQQFIN
ncbi:MAG TPA: ATP-binding cassette domain-containing protein, partial [Rubrivivax sp.]|nr:ATP-binding cassette domain-containing protein [Rubrivivax sp.]